MSDFWLIDQIRSRVFVVELPGMTRQHETDLVRSCRRLARTASAAGVPLTVAWSQLGQYIKKTTPARPSPRVARCDQEPGSVLLPLRLRPSLDDRRQSGQHFALDRRVACSGTRFPSQSRTIPKPTNT